MNKILYLFLLPTVVFGQTNFEKAETFFNQKQYPEAETVLLNHLENQSSDFKAMELLGDTYSFQKKWDEAIEIYTKLVEGNPKNANYFYKQGGALGMKALIVNKFKAIGIVGDAKTSFLKAAELDSHHIDVRWALVELYMQLPGILGGSKSKALKFANELENLSKVDGYLAKGYIYEYDKEPEKAEMYYKQALDAGGSETCFDKLSNFYKNQDKPQKVIETIERAHKAHNKNIMHYQIGKVCADYNIQLEKGERCLKVFIENHSVKDGVPIEWGYYRLAQIHKNKHDKAMALKWINKALAIRSDFGQAEEEKNKILQL